MRELVTQAEDLMKKAVEHLRKELLAVRTSRATPALLDKVMVNYYGTPTPVNQLATISVPEPRLLLVQPWDKSVLGEIERAIMKSDLGLTPMNDGTVIRLVLPQLTQERRQELVKVVRKKAEEGRVAVRNIRREINEDLKSKQKEGGFSEDELKRLQGEVQKLTDKYIKEIDDLLAAKEKEIMEV
ncbi:ribosome recycling factor [Thermodesulfitimonas autotrophica]|uniref:ribosome recycling factor n=1 Tax=Thermodesulfitimonas autotrophica TaxID=1894989 RepID=UPI003FCC877C